MRWRAVESFFDSGPRSRHYVRNPITGKIQFGDGIKGMMPPAGRNNIVARRYQIGGGVRGNVNAMTLTQLTRAIAYIDKCYNAIPAAGGADAETVEEAKARAPQLLKSRDRAVTAEDFETLALRSSTGVARAKCLPSQRHDGEVQVGDRAARRREEPRSDQAPGGRAGAAALREELPRRAAPGRHRASR